MVSSNSTFPDLWFFSDISSVSRAHCPSKLFPIDLEWLIYNPYCRPVPKYILSIHCCLKLQCLEHQLTPGTCGITPSISDRPSLLGGYLSDPTPQYLWLAHTSQVTSASTRFILGSLELGDKLYQWVSIWKRKGEEAELGEKKSLIIK